MPFYFVLKRQYSLQSFVLPRWSVLTLLSSLFFLYLDDLVVLLSQEVWKDETFWSEKEFFSPTNRLSCPFLPGD
jgi:hypothetical protein